MALSDRLAELAQRTKEAEDRVRAAGSEAKDKVQLRVDEASASAKQTAEDLRQRSDAAEVKISDWWSTVQSDWASHVAKVQTKLDARRAERNIERAQDDAD